MILKQNLDAVTLKTPHLYGELPTGALCDATTSISAIAAHQEVRVRVDGYSLCGHPLGAVLDVHRVLVVVDGVHARNHHVLLVIRDVLQATLTLVYTWFSENNLSECGLYNKKAYLKVIQKIPLYYIEQIH